jgi:hypothetical protein
MRGEHGPRLEHPNASHCAPVVPMQWLLAHNLDGHTWCSVLGAWGPPSPCKMSCLGTAHSSSRNCCCWRSRPGGQTALGALLQRFLGLESTGVLGCVLGADGRCSSVYLAAIGRRPGCQRRRKAGGHHRCGPGNGERNPPLLRLPAGGFPGDHAAFSVGILAWPALLNQSWAMTSRAVREARH